MPKGTSVTELQPLDQNRIDYFVRPDLSESQFDAMLHERAEEEAVQIIDSNGDETDGLSTARR